VSDYYGGRLALVVGGSQGIGRSVCLGLARRGAHVVIAARRPEPLAEALAEAGKQRRAADQKLAVLEIDVRDAAGTRAAVERVVAEHGVPDLVVNCAGQARPGFLHQLDPSHLEDQVAVNYLGTAYVCQAFLPHFLQRGSGHLVNTSSLAGLFGLFGYTAYCASKFAVVGFSEALRRELRPHGIRVSVLCPPNTRTPGLEEENRHKPPEVLAVEEKAAVLEPGQVAEALLRALPRGDFLVIPSFDGRLAHLLNRFAPWILESFLKRP
jgi:3-dehydrosphinganine reductase